MFANIYTCFLSLLMTGEGRGQWPWLFRRPQQVQGHILWGWNFINYPQKLLYLSGWSWFQFSIPAWPPLEFFFQEQSYSRLHSGRSLAWDHVRGVIADPCGIVTWSLRRSAAAKSPMVARLTKHHKTLLNKVKHNETFKTLWYIVNH